MGLSRQEYWTGWPFPSPGKVNIRSAKWSIKQRLTDLVMHSNEMHYICPRSPFHDEDHWVFDSEVGCSNLEACPLWKGAHGTHTPNALRLLGWRGELFRRLRFSTFVLSVFKEGKGSSLPSRPEKISSFPSSQNSPQKAGFLWGLKANVLRWGLILLFLQHSACMAPGNRECRMCLEFYTTKTTVFSNLAISSVSVTHSQHKGLDFNLDAKRSLLAPWLPMSPTRQN